MKSCGLARRRLSQLSCRSSFSTRAGGAVCCRYCRRRGPKAMRICDYALEPSIGVRYSRVWRRLLTNWTVIIDAEGQSVVAVDCGRRAHVPAPGGTGADPRRAALRLRASRGLRSTLPRTLTLRPTRVTLIKLPVRRPYTTRHPAGWAARKGSLVPLPAMQRALLGRAIPRSGFLTKGGGGRRSMESSSLAPRARRLTLSRQEALSSRHGDETGAPLADRGSCEADRPQRAPCAITTSSVCSPPLSDPRPATASTQRPTSAASIGSSPCDSSTSRSRRSPRC